MPAWQHQGGVKRCSADAAARRSVQGLQLPELWVLWPIIVLLCHCYDALWTAVVLPPLAGPQKRTWSLQEEMNVGPTVKEPCF